MRIPSFLLVSIVLSVTFVLFSFQRKDKKIGTTISFEDEFSTAEKAKVTEWLEGVSLAVSKTLGNYPFTVNFYIHRKKSHEPVPWAHTIRDGEQAVKFHIDPSFSQSDFERDWTAAHEIAHLSIPYVGRENMWFSEGYASFWQWKILKNQGLFSTKEINEKIQAKLLRLADDYDTEATFVEQNKALKSRHNYPAVYWGGACYFFKVDAELRKNHHTSLQEVIQKYQKSGRLKDESLEEVLASFDRISRSDVFSKLFLVFKNGSAREAVSGTVIDF